MNRRALGGLVAVATTVAPPQRSLAAEPDVYAPLPGSLAGRTVVVTGANTGLGLETCARLAAVDAVEARTGAKIEGAVLDLASLESVRSFPERLKRDRVDVLVENAGVMAIPDRSTTEDGFERQIGVNFLGHYALVGALLPKLEKAGTFRIVCVSSDASKIASASGIDAALAEDLDPAAYSAWGNYALSKAFNVLFASELQRRLDAR